MKKLSVGLSLGLALLLAACGTVSSSIASSSANSSSGVLTTVDETPPVIFGADVDAFVPVGSEWNPLDGVYAYDNLDGVLTPTVSGAYNLAVIGEYDLTYTVEDEEGNEATQARTLHVVPVTVIIDETPPVLFGADVDADVLVGSTWDPLTGVYAYDSKDGVIALITVTGTYDLDAVGEYTLTYSVKDAANNTTTEERLLTVFAPEADAILPVIYTSDVTILQNRPFTPMDNVYAYDLVDGDLTSEVTVTGTFNPNAVGTYTLTYKVKDSANNEATKTRVLTVIAPADFEVMNSQFDLPFPASLTNLGTSDTRANNPLATAYREDRSGFNWGFHNNGNGIFTASAENGIATVEVKNLGPNEFGVQLYQINRRAISGTTYVIQFRAKADDARSVRMILEGGGGARRLDVYYNLATEWQTFTYIHTSPASYTNGKFGFFIGQASIGDVPTKVYFDYVNVSPITNPVANLANNQGPDVLGALDIRVLKDANFDPLRGVSFRDRSLNAAIPLTTGTPAVPNPKIEVIHSVDTALVGTYPVTYKVTDAAGLITEKIRQVSVEEAATGKFVNTVQLFNTDFSTPRAASADTRPSGAGSALTDDWTWHGSILTGYTVGIADGEAVVDITSTTSHAVWSPHFYFLNRYLEVGTAYEVTWKARADVARPMAFRLEAGVGTLRHEETFTLTTSMATYTTRFVAGNISGPLANAKFAFTFGNSSTIATKIYVDDVSVKVIAEPTAVGVTKMYNLFDVTIPVDGIFNATQGITVYNPFDASVNLANVTITGDQIEKIGTTYEFDSSVPGVYTVNYSIVDRYGVTTSVVRTVTVTAVTS